MAATKTNLKRVKQSELNIDDAVVSVNDTKLQGRISRIESGHCFVDFTKANQKSKLTKVSIDDLRGVVKTTDKNK